MKTITIGTKKQIKWANDFRVKSLEYIQFRISRLENRPEKTEIEILKEQKKRLENTNDSIFVINNFWGFDKYNMDIS